MYEFELDQYESAHKNVVMRTAGWLRKEVGEEWVTHFWGGLLERLPYRNENGTIALSTVHEIAKDANLLHIKPFENARFGYSKFIKGLTVAAFQQYMNEAMERVSLKPEEITAMRMLIALNGKPDHRNPAFLAMSNRLMPLYLELRKAGFSHFDLTGIEIHRPEKKPMAKVLEFVHFPGWERTLGIAS